MTNTPAPHTSQSSDEPRAPSEEPRAMTESATLSRYALSNLGGYDTDTLVIQEINSSGNALGPPTPLPRGKSVFYEMGSNRRFLVTTQPSHDSKLLGHLYPSLRKLKDRVPNGR